MESVPFWLFDLVVQKNLPKMHVAPGKRDFLPFPASGLYSQSSPPRVQKLVEKGISHPEKKFASICFQNHKRFCNFLTLSEKVSVGFALFGPPVGGRGTINGRKMATRTKKGTHVLCGRTSGLRAEIVYGGDIQSIDTDH